MKIDRRSFVVGLSAALALPAACSADAAEGEIAEATALPALRDMLLPGLWQVTKEYGPDYESDIMVDFKADALIVKAYRHSTRQAFGFAILRPSIEDGRYKAEFKPTLDRLFKVVSQAMPSTG